MSKGVPHSYRGTPARVISSAGVILAHNCRGVEGRKGPLTQEHPGDPPGCSCQSLGYWALPSSAITG